MEPGKATDYVNNYWSMNSWQVPVRSADLLFLEVYVGNRAYRFSGYKDKDYVNITMLRKFRLHFHTLINSVFTWDDATDLTCIPIDWDDATNPSDNVDIAVLIKATNLITSMLKESE